MGLNTKFNTIPLFGDTCKDGENDKTLNWMSNQHFGELLAHLTESFLTPLKV